MFEKREFGDYQTPIDFSEKLCDILISDYHIKPDVVIEPTCGTGSFLKSALIFNAQKYYGIEVNPKYCEICRKEIKDSRVEIINADLFKYNIKSLASKNALVIGNPPWATNSTLSSLKSVNLPVKTNFKKMTGLEAMTGGANFDICEYIILKLIEAFYDTDAVIAMLCKTSVAHNVFKELKRRHTNFKFMNVYEFDSSKVFGVSVGACFMVLQLANGLTDDFLSPDSCNVYCLDDDTKQVQSRFGYVHNLYYNDLLNASVDFDGTSCFEWRQGIKHDCSKIVELNLKDNVYVNGYGMPTNIESDLVFPLVKSSMLKSPVINKFQKYVIVTQRKSGGDTEYIRQELPLTYRYLKENEDAFDSRKSCIYLNAPEFSMFGVGEYSFSQFKVCISGFYKTPLFSVIYSMDGKPVMTDDTCYFICFPTFGSAYVAMLYLNSAKCQKFLSSISYVGAKRPYTKKILQRLDFSKMCKEISIDELEETEQKLNLPHKDLKEMVLSFSEIVRTYSGNV